MGIFIHRPRIRRAFKVALRAKNPKPHAKKEVAVGMTLDEVTLLRGSPTKSTFRKTASGQSGSWEYIDYEEIKNYVNEVDRLTGNIYRRLVSVTR